MTPPAPMKCLKTGCEWHTPQNCPTWANQIELLKIHTNVEHPQAVPVAGASAGAGAGTGVKSEKLPRPTLEEEISESDWNFFNSKWRRYKRATKLEGQDVVDQLWACMSDGLERQCHDHGASADTTTEQQLLDLMRAFSLRGVNKLCNVVDYLNLKQEENESITKFISRVRGQALTCDFKVKCTKEGCNEVVSYADKLSSHIIVRGLYNLDIQEDVLKLAATTEDDLDLKKITETALAAETGCRSRKLLNEEEDAGLHKLSAFKKQQRSAGANVDPPRNDIQVQDEKCSHCGQIGHGYSASPEVRKALCPAWDKQCSKCNLPNHYTALCRKKRNGTANALEFEEERSSQSESDNEDFGFFAMNSNRTRKQTKTMDPLPHYVFDKTSGKWKVEKAEPQPEVIVNVQLCKEGYKQIGAAPPRRFYPYSVPCTSLPDTGSQIVVAGPDLLNKLGIMPSELFPVTTNVKLGDRKRLQLIGGMLITISAVASDGSTKTSSHMCYVGEKIEKLFLSREACLKLNIIGENFPNSKLINEKSSNSFTFAALQLELPKPTSQQMMGTPGTQWKEIDTVVNILDKLSQQYFDHRNNFRGGKVNIV